jgi:hypothetical protein
MINGWTWLKGIPVYAEVIEAFANLPNRISSGDTEGAHQEL